MPGLLPQASLPVPPVSDRFESHQENMSVKCIPPLIPLLYSKNGVCRDIHFFIFDPKHRLWVLVGTASLRRF